MIAGKCNKCGRPMAGTTAYDGACECGGLIEAVTGTLKEAYTGEQVPGEEFKRRRAVFVAKIKAHAPGPMTPDKLKGAVYRAFHECWVPGGLIVEISPADPNKLIVAEIPDRWIGD